MLCTDDSGSPTSGCVFAHNTLTCDDADACTSSDKCGAGKKIQLRFRFDSVDGVSNGGTGWFVEALTVAAAPLPAFADGIGCNDKTKWTIANAQAAPLPLWAIDANASPPGYASADCSLNFNNGIDFACTTGKVSGTATSSTFTVVAAPVGKKAYLAFQAYQDGEGGTFFDLLQAEISDHGYATAANLVVITPKTVMGAWTNQKIDITALAAAGKTLQVRFNFDSKDCAINNGKGPFIDDVRIEYGL